MKNGRHESEVELLQDLEINFKLLFQSGKKWEELVNNADKSVSSFNYLYNHYEHTNSYKENSEVAKDYPKLKDNLISKILDKIGEEIKILSDTVSECKRLSENLIQKRGEITERLFEVNGTSPASKELLKGVATFNEGVNSLEILYISMLVAFTRAKDLEAAIPKCSFSYSPQQKQTMDRLEEIWNFCQTTISQQPIT